MACQQAPQLLSQLSLLIQSCSPPVNPHSVCACTWGGVILPLLPQQSLLASLLWVPYQ